MNAIICGYKGICEVIWQHKYVRLQCNKYLRSASAYYGEKIKDDAEEKEEEKEGLEREKGRFKHGTNMFKYWFIYIYIYMRNINVVDILIT